MFDLELRLFDLALCLSDAADLVSTVLVNHHKQTAYFSRHIGEELGLSNDRLQDLTLAAMMHDLGALAIYESLDQLVDESEPELDIHAAIGHDLISDFPPLHRVSRIVRYHHARWNNNLEIPGDYRVEANILFLADHLSRSLTLSIPVLDQVNRILEDVKDRTDEFFMSEAVGALLVRSRASSFWFDAVSPNLGSLLRRQTRSTTVRLDIFGVVTVSKIFARIVDSRSRFTATHSAGVAGTACALASLMAFSEREVLMMHIAGNLHDLGKLAVPRSILEKPGKLTREEMNVVRCHTYHTYRILETIPGFETIGAWAAFHHERLDGKGYPFRVDHNNLTLGSRIMAVADVFTAIAEDRPYREGLPLDKTISIIKRMASDGALDSSLVSALESNLELVNEARIVGHKEAVEFAVSRNPTLDERGYTYNNIPDTHPVENPVQQPQHT